MRFLKNEPLRRHSSFKIGGPARYFCSPRNASESGRALRFAKERGLNFRVIGNGSNILFADRGFDGLVIRPGMTEISVNGNNVIAGAGTPIQHLLGILAESGLAGLEFMTGIPGTAGGSVAMNAGTGERGIGEKVVRVWVLGLDGKEKIFSPKQCRFGYRKSIFQNKKSVITKVQFRLKKGRAGAIRARIRERWKSRLARQPYDLPSAGSVFKNPKGDFAGRLIEAAGLKGTTVGGAQVSKKHANFIVNLGQARAADVVKLISQVKSKVYSEFKIKLVPEIILDGRNSP